MQNGEKNGFGEECIKKGFTYKGYFLNGKMNGEG